MKFKILFYTIFLIFLLVLQSTLLGYVRIYNVKPNLIVIFIISVALLKGNVEGGIVGFFAGMLLDMSFGKFLGFYALLGMYLGIAVGSINKRLYRENLLVIIFFTFVFTILYESTVNVLSTFMSGNIDIIQSITTKILPEAIYNSIVSIFIFTIVRRFNQKFEETDKSTRKY